MISRRTILGTAAAPLVARFTNVARRRWLWREGAPLNQWDTDRCTAWAAAAGVLGGMPPMTIAESQAVARRIWLRAEQLDVYPGRVPGGVTTMQGSAAALVELELCESVQWFATVDQVLDALHRGPVVFVAQWVVGMWTPRDDRIKYGSDQPPQGGHAAAITGYDPTRGIRIRNSWGRSWGRDGSVWLSVSDLRKLWAWQPPADFPGPHRRTYCEAYQLVKPTFPPIREAAE